MEKRYFRLLIIDGSHTLHRAISEPHLWEMKNRKGERTGGIFGTLQSIQKECGTYNYFPVVVFDGHLSQRRLEIYPNYKRNQEKQLLQESLEEPTEIELLQQEQRLEYNRQREVLKILLPSLGIPVIHLEDWEGDDIIYILSRLTKDSVILSDDKDMLQLFTDTDDMRCRIRRGMRDEFITGQWFKDNALDVNSFVIRKAIIGDPSDNIPSACYQVGEKTALGLYELYNKTKGEFPKDEKQLTEVCKKYNLSKRKAYLNFDETQFLKNLLLMDLSLVEDEVTEDLIEQIDEIISAHINYKNIELTKNILNDLEIKSFMPISLIDRINDVSKYITDLPFNNTNFRAIKETNTSEIKQVTLF